MSDALGHREEALRRFVDRQLPLDSVLSLGAQFLAEDVEVVAEVLDGLVSKGLLRCADGVVEPGVSDIYNERLPSSDQTHLDSEAKKGDPMKAIYDEWNALAGRHPEWTIVRRPEHSGESLRMDLDDPYGALESLRGKVKYDESSVRPGDEDDFERFLELDRRIEEFEAGGGYARGASLARVVRAMALWRMAGGRVPGIGLFCDGVRVVRAQGIGPGRGDIVRAIAEEIAEREHNAQLVALPMEEQMRVMEKAEHLALERYPMTSSGAFGMDDPSEQAPAPDPEKAPQGWEKITGPDGKASWRSKTDPNTKLERPDANA